MNFFANYSFLLFLTMGSIACTHSAARSIDTGKIVSSTTQENPIELGSVTWFRNYDEALKQAKLENKPILILFQEVPGCNTCTRYGTEVLSHPLIVEAIEAHFIPLAIHNNKSGHNRDILEKFGEPSWNNPVVRILDKNENALVPRLGNDYSPHGLSQRMIAALEKLELEVPGYLSLMEQEFYARETSVTEQATFSMFCFWTGEKVYGELDGVVDTKAGFMHGQEVVQVSYIPSIISFDELAKKGKSQQCASHVFSNDQIQLKSADKIVGSDNTSEEGSFRSDREPKYYLSKTYVKYLPMMPIQQARVNAALGRNQDYSTFLSPNQIALLEKIVARKAVKWENHIDSGNFVEAWNDTQLKLER